MLVYYISELSLEVLTSQSISRLLRSDVLNTHHMLLTYAVMLCLQLHTVRSAYTVHADVLLCLQLHTVGSAYTVHAGVMLCLELHTVGSAYTVHAGVVLCLQLHTVVFQCDRACKVFF
jgi:hypothetical protein